MNAAAVPQGWHSFDTQGNYCTVCGRSTAGIISERVEFGICICIPLPTVPEGRDEADAQGPQETGPLGPYWIYPAARVSERELDLPVLSATTSGVDARVGQRGGDGVTHEGDEPE